VTTADLTQDFERELSRAWIAVGGALVASIRHTDARFDAVDRRFEAVDRRFDRVEQRVDDLQAQLNSFEIATNKRFDRIDAQLERLIDYVVRKEG
jgi:hypothetical protein